jgi:hypothetical protein
MSVRKDVVGLGDLTDEEAFTVAQMKNEMVRAVSPTGDLRRSLSTDHLSGLDLARPLDDYVNPTAVRFEAGNRLNADEVKFLKEAASRSGRPSMTLHSRVVADLPPEAMEWSPSAVAGYLRDRSAIAEYFDRIPSMTGPLPPDVLTDEQMKRAYAPQVFQITGGRAAQINNGNRWMLGFGETQSYAKWVEARPIGSLFGNPTEVEGKLPSWAKAIDMPSGRRVIWGGYTGPLTPEGLSGIREYTSDFYLSGNPWLRGTATRAVDAPDIAQTVEHITAGIQQGAATEEAAMTFRSIRGSLEDLNKVSLRVGTIFRDPAFGSTSLSQRFCDEWATGDEMYISVPKGSHSVIGAQPMGEAELIQQRDTAYIIDRIEKVGQYKRYYVRVVGVATGPNPTDIILRATGRP